MIGKKKNVNKRTGDENMKKLIALVVDDSAMLVTAAHNLSCEKYEVVGLLSYRPGVTGPRRKEWGHRDAVTAADVIFLDHNMPGKNGEQWLAYWKEEVDLSGKTIIGTSSDRQSYVSRQIDGSCAAICYELDKICQEGARGSLND